ncbi:UDP-N-acetylglucosamine transporter [Colletotrichum orbiculare MAFF 240422]|uniref:UDP-N-acetylglucosamine transporter n=1 Tax=Colletotrichum orbiculare (strain 104-T / ATCC 96160 / CBS 514.97 / LARS 414 / MAFF 240422) TaxID=1213857 RepID=A0A484FLB6_COLOR|nr:UDP-N-acetylglucosamine transporter [Colletotrichum orbiculare MAFF 240422]
MANSWRPWNQTQAQAGIALSLLMVQNASSLLLQHKLQHPSTPESPVYNPLTVVVLSELLKLVVSIVALLWTAPTDSDANVKEGSLRRLLQHGHLGSAIPAVMYTAAAASQAVGARNLSLLPYLMLSQVKLILTPVFGMLLLKQVLSRLQWVYLFVMTAGIMLVQLGSTAEAFAAADVKQNQRLAVGIVSMAVAGFCVAFSGVYMEACFKSNGSFLARNAQLAGYSLVFALLGILVQSGVNLESFFAGYNWLVGVLVVLQAVGGFVVSWCVRITSTVAKNYAQGLGFLAASMIPLLSVSGDMKQSFYFGALCVLWGVFGSMWSANKEKGKPNKEQEKSEAERSWV